MDAMYEAAEALLKVAREHAPDAEHIEVDGSGADGTFVLRFYGSAGEVDEDLYRKVFADFDIDLIGMFSGPLEPCVDLGRELPAGSYTLFGVPSESEAATEILDNMSDEEIEAFEEADFTFVDPRGFGHLDPAEVAAWIQTLIFARGLT